jgi:hypothetical protein
MNKTSTLNELKEYYFNINEIPNNLDKNKFNFFVNDKRIIDFNNNLDKYLDTNDYILEIIVLYDLQNNFDECSTFVIITDYKIMKRKYYTYCSQLMKIIDIKTEYSEFLKNYDIQINPNKIRLLIYAKETISEEILEKYAPYQKNIVFNLLI